jgi:hypothetical protein
MIYVVASANGTSKRRDANGLVATTTELGEVTEKVFRRLVSFE